MLKRVLFLYLFCSVTHVFGESFLPHLKDDLQERRSRFVDIVGGVFENCYATLRHKERYYGFDFKSEVSSFRKEMINSTYSVVDFQKRIHSLMAKVRDPHCTVVNTYPTYMSYLPIKMFWVDDEICVSHVDHSHKSYVKPGDRVLSIDGVDVLQLAHYKCAEVFGIDGRQPNWARQYICQLLFNSGPRWLSDVRSGHASVCLSNECGSYMVNLPWIVVYDVFSIPSLNESAPDFSTGVKQMMSRWMGSTHLFREVPEVKTITFVDNRDLSSNRYATSGSLENYYPGCPASFVPPMGISKWHSRGLDKCKIDASIYDALDISIGYIRIGGFVDWCFDELDSYLNKMQQECDVLVLDVMSNTGGFGGRALGLAARLSSSDLKTHAEALMVSPTLCELGKQVEELLSERHRGCLENMDVIDFGSFGVFKATDSSLSALRGFCDQIRSAIIAGDSYIYPAYWMGIETIDGVGLFTKPVVILADRYTMSSAESFLEIIKKNNKLIKSVIIGENTAGVASGTGVVTIPNCDGIAGISYSWTLIVSSEDGELLEDRGICPDVYYSPSMYDIRNGFGLFRKTILSTCRSLVYSNKTESSSFTSSDCVDATDTV